MAFGGVATGSINAQLAAMVAGMTKSIGSCPIPMAEEARIGRNAAAVAVLLVISVRKMTTRITTSISSRMGRAPSPLTPWPRSEEHTSELQSRGHLVCRLLLEKKKHKHQREQQYD